MPNVAFPAGLSHDRYLIYEMMGQQVSFTFHGRKEKKVAGVAQQVCRDIFENQIELTVGGKAYRFKEPDVISASPDTKSVVLFVYGKPADESAMSDKALFAEVRAVPFKGETMDDVIHRTKQGKTKVLKFALSPAPADTYRRCRRK